MLKLNLRSSAWFVTAAAVLAAPALAQSPGVTLSESNVPLDEAPGTVQANVGAYTVVLNTAPTGSVTVTATSDHATVTVDTDATPLTRDLTFTTGDWNTAQTVAVTVLQDGDSGNESATISHTVSGYGSVASAASVSVMVRDDDVPSLRVESATENTPVPTRTPSTWTGTGGDTRTLITLPNGNTHISRASQFWGANNRVLNPFLLATTTPQTVRFSGVAGGFASLERRNVACRRKTLEFFEIATGISVPSDCRHVGDEDTALSITLTSAEISYGGVLWFWAAVSNASTATIAAQWVPIASTAEFALSPAFAVGTTEYEATAAASAIGYVVTPVFDPDDVSIAVNGGSAATAKSGDGHVVGKPLSSTITDTVAVSVAGGGGTTTYTLRLQRGEDYDADGDRLVDIATLPQLDAVRYDLDGDGVPETGTSTYRAAFSNPAAGGCLGTASCLGYELANDLDFDTDGSGDVDASDDYSNWTPIGGSYAAVFDGNNRTISNLTIAATAHAGLFHTLSASSTVRNLGLADVDATLTGSGGAVYLGALAARNYGAAIGVWSSGSVVGSGNGTYVGGLLGYLGGRVAASYSSATATGVAVGGLISQGEGRVTASYATGVVTTYAIPWSAGGLIGINSATSTIEASYFAGVATSTVSTWLGGLVGRDFGLGALEIRNSYFSSGTTGLSGTGAQTNAALQVPTTASGIYADWDDLDVDGDGSATEDPWSFGSAYDFPVLSYGGLDTAAQFAIQPDLAPSFGGGTVTDRTMQRNQPIQAFQVPAASGGSGALSYRASGLPTGLIFDDDGSGSCAGNLPRTVCGTPTAATGDYTATITVSDADSNMASGDEDELTFTVTLVTASAAITASIPSPLAKANLNGAMLTVTLTNSTFSGSAAAAHFTLAGVPGLSVGSLSAAGATATLTLSYDGTNFITTQNLSVTVAAAAHALAGPLTATVDVLPDPRVAVSTANLSLTEASGSNSATYTVALAAAPFATSTVTATSTNPSVTIDGDATPLAWTFTFTPQNWNTAQTVTVTAVQDGDAGDETVTVEHTVVGYPEVTTVTVSVTDDDSPSLGVAAIVPATDAPSPARRSCCWTVGLPPYPDGTDNEMRSATGARYLLATTTAQTVYFEGITHVKERQHVFCREKVLGGNNFQLSNISGQPVGTYRSNCRLVGTSYTSLTVSLSQADIDFGGVVWHAAVGGTTKYSISARWVPIVAPADALELRPAFDATRTSYQATYRGPTTTDVELSPVLDSDTVRVAVNGAATSTVASGGVGSVALSGGETDTVTVSTFVGGATTTYALTLDGAPNFATSTLAARTFQQGQPIAEFQVLAATAGTGTLSYRASGLPPGIDFDADGGGACPGNEPREFCGTPTTDGVYSVTVTVSDSDANQLPVDEDTVTFTATVETATATITQTSPSSLTEANVDGAVLTVELSNTTYVAGATTTHFTLATNVPGLSVASVAPVATATTTQFRVTLSYDDTNFDTPSTVAVRVAAAAHALAGTLQSNTAAVSPNRGVTVSATTVSVAENGSATYTVRLDSPPTGVVTIDVSGAGSGISANPTRLTFNSSNWNAPATVTVQAADDTNTTNESVTLAHAVSGADYGANGVTAPSVSVTATDDDVPSLRVSTSALTVPEGSSSSYQLRLNTQPSAAVTVTVVAPAGLSVDTDGGTPGDQTTLSFDANNWNADRTVTVRAAEDDDASDNSFALSHTAQGGDYTGLIPARRPGVAVTVEDDDEPALVIDANPSTPNTADSGPLLLAESATSTSNSVDYTVRLATLPTHAVTVAIESGDGAVSVDGTQMVTLSFSTSTWSMPQTVTAQAAQDDDASDERVTIAHTAQGGDYSGVDAELAAEVTDDDEPALAMSAAALLASGVAEGGTASYTVALATQPTGPLQVSIAAAGGVEIDADSDQAGPQSSLRFDATNWNAPRTVTVRGVEDDDGADGQATLTHSATGADYGGVSSLLSFSVSDDETPALTADVSALAVNEGSSATYTLTLATQPSTGTVTVEISSSDASAATASPDTLTFGAADWNAPRTVMVNAPAESDATNTADAAATLTHTATGADYGTAPTPTVSVTVRDSEAPGVRLEPTRLVMDEGGTATYQVRLNTAPTANTTVEATVAAELSLDEDATPTTRTLTFTTTDWNTAQTVQVSAAEDDDALHESVTIAHSVTGYSGVPTAPSLTVLVVDDEAPGLEFDPPSGLRLSEGDPAASTGSYELRLSSEPSGTVTVALSSDDAGLEFDADSLLPGDQTSVTFDAANWSTNKTVSVRSVLDADAASETATLTHSATGGGYNVLAEYQVVLADADAAGTPTGVSATVAGPTSLEVRWTAGSNAQAHLVQWRAEGQGWSTARQMEVSAGVARALLGGLQTGTRYLVRVIGLNRGYAGEASAEASGTPETQEPTTPQENRAPEATDSELTDLFLHPGETTSLELFTAFLDPDGDTLSYQARSSDNSVAVARAVGATLEVSGVAAGVVEITVSAADPGGLSAERSLQATVGLVLSVSARAEAAEGGEARLRVALSQARDTATAFRWRISADADPATADADAGEHGDASGEGSVAAGERHAEIVVRILDDDDIEAPREWFMVTVESLDESTVAVGAALVAVQEGVCDRTPQIRDALSAGRDCTAPTEAQLGALRALRLGELGIAALAAADLRDLGSLRSLDLRGNTLTGLPAGLLSTATSLRHLLLGGNRLVALERQSLSGLANLIELDLSDNALAGLPAGLLADLPALRRVRLDGNQLAELPTGLFAGAEGLRSLRLDGNPGAPFALSVRLERSDAEAEAPGPATVRAVLAAGAPFAMEVRLSATGSQASPESLQLPAGATQSGTAQVEASAFAQVSATMPAPPQTECDGLPCWRGLEAGAVSPLALFAAPPTAGEAPTPESLYGSTLRLPLASLAAGGTGSLSWQVYSSDESVATARVSGSDLLIEPAPFAEGVVEIEAVATDANGQRATVRFPVRVEFHWPFSRVSGWRTVIDSETAK